MVKLLKNKFIVNIILVSVIILESIFLLNKSIKIDKYEKIRQNNDFYLIERLYLDTKKSKANNNEIISNANTKINFNLISQQAIISKNLFLTLDKIIDNARQYRQILNNESIPTPKINKFVQMQLVYENILNDALKSNNYTLSSKKIDDLKIIDTVLSKIMDIYKEYSVEDSLQFKIKTLTDDKWKDLAAKISQLFDNGENNINTLVPPVQ